MNAFKPLTCFLPLQASYAAKLLAGQKSAPKSETTICRSQRFKDSGQKFVNLEWTPAWANRHGMTSPLDRTSSYTYLSPIAIVKRGLGSCKAALLFPFHAPIRHRVTAF